jgi:site-specific recombinase XerD
MQGEGLVTADLSRGIPGRRRVRLAREPKHIAWKDIERLISAADVTDPVGLRDRAVVMLSAHLGLRNGEIRHLLLDDLDWRHGILRVNESKGGKSREMPLPAPVGEVLAEYIRYGRPCSTRREVFLRHRAPGGVLGTTTGVSNIIQRLAKRAGVALPRNGQNVLRHSLATHLVNREVSIKAICDLLGHASIDTTAIYTLVDMTTLARVAMPFPGEVE